MFRTEIDPGVGGVKNPENPAASGLISSFLHEVRNPLSTMQTLAKLLQKRLPPQDRNHWIGTSIEQECSHLQALLRRFEQNLAIDRPMEIGALCIEPFLQHLEPIYQALAEAQGQTFRLEGLGQTHYPDLQVDPLALKQALDNLIDNACKYTPSGGQICLHIKPGDHPQEVCLTVADSGPGIEPAHLSRIFDPYFRVHADQQTGQGLGLAITQELIHSMGGRIQVESTPGAGTQFQVILPTASEGAIAHDR